jgi:hypothetical protein
MGCPTLETGILTLAIVFDFFPLGRLDARHIEAYSQCDLSVNLRVNSLSSSIIFHHHTCRP